MRRRWRVAMSKIDDMIVELRPDGVEYEWFGDACIR